MKKANKVSSDMLIAIYQNLLTARQSISNVIEKVHDSKLKQELQRQYNSYSPIKEQCEKYAQEYLVDIVDNSFFEKARMWMSVNMSILLDKSNRKIASICIIGNTMGLIDLMCVMSDCSKGKKEFLELAGQLSQLEDSNTEALKPYLLKENNKPQKPASVKAENSAAQDQQDKSNTKSKSTSNPTKPGNAEESKNSQNNENIDL
jgi:hypothetical protein